jgi:hypothetical protein
VSGTSSQRFLYDAPAKLCIAEAADWNGGVTFNQDGTLEICGSAAPSWSYFNGARRELLVRVTGTLDISGAPSSAVDNEGLVRVAGALIVDPGHPWTNRGRIEVAGDQIVNGNAQLELDSDSVIEVDGTFGNNGTVDGIGAFCGAIRVGGSTATNSGVIRNNADVCPLTDDTGAGPDIPSCSCSPTPHCGR